MGERDGAQVVFNEGSNVVFVNVGARVSSGAVPFATVGTNVVVPLFFSNVVDRDGMSVPSSKGTAVSVSLTREGVNVVFARVGTRDAVSVLSLPLEGTEVVTLAGDGIKVGRAVSFLGTTIVGAVVLVALFFEDGVGAIVVFPMDGSLVVAFSPVGAEDGASVVIEFVGDNVGTTVVTFAVLIVGENVVALFATVGIWDIVGALEGTADALPDVGLVVVVVLFDKLGGGAPGSTDGGLVVTLDDDTGGMVVLTETLGVRLVEGSSDGIMEGRVDGIMDGINDGVAEVSSSFSLSSAKTLATRFPVGRLSATVL